MTTVNEQNIPNRRFWSRVEKSDACWLWTGQRTKAGYGQLRPFSGKLMYAHRYSWELHNGPIPPATMVCHHCDNPPCVRPDHLFLGSAADNNADMRSKGRENKAVGEDAGTAKLTEDQVRAIREAAFEFHMGIVLLGRIAGVTGETIRAILTGETWSHIGGEKS